MYSEYCLQSVATAVAQFMKMAEVEKLPSFVSSVKKYATKQVLYWIEKS